MQRLQSQLRYTYKSSRGGRLSIYKGYLFYTQWKDKG